MSEPTRPVPPTPVKTPPIVCDSASDRALDRSEDPGEPTAATVLPLAPWALGDIGETAGVAQRHQQVRTVSGSHDRSGTRSSRVSVRPR